MEWLIELQAADADGAIYAAFQQWRAAHPDYEFAWQHIEAMNTRFNGLASPLGSAVARAVLTSHRSLKRRQIIKTLVVILFLVVPAGGLKRKFPGVHGWPMNGLMSVSSATLH